MPPKAVSLPIRTYYIVVVFIPYSCADERYIDIASAVAHVTCAGFGALNLNVEVYVPASSY